MHLKHGYLSDIDLAMSPCHSVRTPSYNYISDSERSEYEGCNNLMEVQCLDDPNVTELRV